MHIEITYFVGLIILLLCFIGLAVGFYIFKNQKSNLNTEPILDICNSGILITAENKIELINEEFCKIYGISKLEFLNSKKEIDRFKFKNYYFFDETETLEEHKEYIFYKKGNFKTEVEIKSAPINYKNQECRIFFITDISQRKKRDVVLIENEILSKINENIATQEKLLFRKILDNLPLMLSIYDSNGRLFLQNTFIKNKFGWEENDLFLIDDLAKTVRDPLNYGLLKLSLNSKNEDWTGYTMLDKNGNTFETEWTSLKTENEFLIRIGIDVSEKNQIKKEQIAIIKKLEFATKTLEEREQILNSNQYKLQESNAQLYEQNKKLEENESILKLINAATYEGIFMTSDGIIFKHNDTASSLLEINESELEGTPFSNLIVPSQRELISKIINDNINIANQEVHLIKNSGKLFYGELQSKSFTHQNKNIIIFTVRDITYRKKIEIAAKNNENNIRNLVNNLQTGILVLMQNGELFANSTFQTMTHLDIENPHFNFIDCIEPEFKNEIYQQIKSITFDTHNSWSKDIVIKPINSNSSSFVNITIIETYFKQNQAILISLTDINQRKSSEINLNQSFSYQKALLDSGDIAYWAGDKDFKLLFSNRFFDIMTQKFLNNKLSIGEDVRPFFGTVFTKNHLEEHYIKALSNESSTLSIQIKNTWLELNFSAINENNEITGVLVRIKDITEQFNQINYIKENEQLLSTIIDNLPVIFNLMDSNGVTLRINKELERFFNTSPTFSPVGVYNVTKDFKLFDKGNIELIKKVFKGEKVKLQSSEVNLSRVTGRKGMENASGIKYLDSLFTPIFDSNGILKFIVYLGIDTTENILKSKELVKKHQDIIEATKQISEFKLVALRAAMNPHFVFNVLNSIQFYIASNDKEQALSYLSLFSKLIRKILENSLSNRIAINEEITMLKYYIDLENMRFENKFDVEFKIDESLLDEEIQIPSLIIQPYVENAIIHGLLHKKNGKGKLSISIIDHETRIECRVEDNGIGRVKANELRKMEHKSLGTKVTEERLKIINKFDEINVDILDLYDKNQNATGTRTTIFIKIN